MDDTEYYVEHVAVLREADAETSNCSIIVRRTTMRSGRQSSKRDTKNCSFLGLQYETSFSETSYIICFAH